MRVTSGEKRRMGSITKCGPRMLRHLVVEAARSAIRMDKDIKWRYNGLLHRRDAAKATVAIARHLLVTTYIMMRDEIDHAEFKRRGVAVRSARSSNRPNVPEI